MVHRERSQPTFAGDNGRISRRSFLQSTTALVGTVTLGGLFGSSAWGNMPKRYPIDTPAVTTRERMLAFPIPLTPGLKKTELNQVSRYDEFGYGEWSFGSGLPVMERTDLMPAGYEKPANATRARLVKFFAFTDV